MDRQSRRDRKGAGRFSWLAGRVLGILLACLALAVWPALAEENCPSGPFSSYTASQPGAKGSFSLFSDVHFSPFADPSLVRELAASPVEWWRAILARSKPGLSPYGQDANNALFQSFLDDMAARSPRPDFILFPGDLLCHDFWTLYPKLSKDRTQAGLEAFIQKTVAYFFSEVARRFPGVPVYAALGNNDSVEGDYRIAPNSPYLTLTAQAMAALLPSESARADFGATYPQYGCYAVTLAEAGGVRLVVINNVFLSTKHPNAALGDPVLAFLERELAGAKARGQKVWLMAHIPPGDDSMASGVALARKDEDRYKGFLREEQNEAYAKLLAAYAPTVVKAAFAGHVHRDDFRIWKTSSGEPAGGMGLAPSISPITGNNPGYQLHTYDRATLELLDVATYFLDLAKPGTGWREEYVWSAAYGRGLRDPADWQATYLDLGQCPARREAFAAHFDLGSPHVEVTEASFPAFWRAIASPTRTVWEAWSPPTALAPWTVPLAGQGGAPSPAAAACPGGS
ncbi:phosphodiesterase [Solidesulfovibrio carbinolicus]|uniref:Phosphodiesterase n=1 Tax=Solidesulfovibrio carbinolicus TaxID=296842 RepID=A0A4P6HP55_9BACT|nr:phosphodiesterase [Solidesulfovibrio carbinolicus]